MFVRALDTVVATESMASVAAETGPGASVVMFPIAVCTTLGISWGLIGDDSSGGSLEMWLRRSERPPLI